MRFTKQQKQFVTAKHDSSLLLRACPGAGKTYSIRERALYLQRAGRTVFLLVFNRKAVGEFQSVVPNASTIDSFFRLMLKNHQHIAC